MKYCDYVNLHCVEKNEVTRLYLIVLLALLYITLHLAILCHLCNNSANAEIQRVNSNPYLLTF